MSPRLVALLVLLTLALDCGPAGGQPLVQQKDSRALFGDSVGAGLTLTFNRQTGIWVVRRVWRGSPAEKSRIRPGERILAINGVLLPAGQGGPEEPCQSDPMPARPEDLRQRIDKARKDRRMRVTVERNGRPVVISMRAEPLATLYAQAQAESPPTTEDPFICMDCDQKTCPAAKNNNGYWTCLVDVCGDITTVKCKDPCLTS